MRPTCSLITGAILTVALVTNGSMAADQAGSGAAPSDETYDLVVVGGTPGGIAMAVRAAREGEQVLLVNRHEHLGGILSSGLGVWDTLYEGKRSPIYDQWRKATFDYYRDQYGPDSKQYQNALPGKSGHTNGKFEPKVAEKIADALVAAEPNLTVIKSHVPARVERKGDQLEAVVFESTALPKDQRTRQTIRGRVFADCTYEGDLLALAKVPYRVGREGRSEFDERHAGQIYMKGVPRKDFGEPAELIAERNKLNLRHFRGAQIILEPESTGQEDDVVQAFNYRTILSSDPENRIFPEKPANYDPAFLRTLEHSSKVAPIPNRKVGWNRPQIVGIQTRYVEGNEEERRAVEEAHWNATLGLLYYLQNDPAVPAKLRGYWKNYGLARDEFVDHHHRPYEFYVREARRLDGRKMFTEHDALLAPHAWRAPLHADSIAITEWYLDTHACHAEKKRGSLDEGKMMLDLETWPGQVSYECLLPKEVDNLLVPVCLSSTHVAWGTIRLEPTWMNIAEAAAYAVALSHQAGVTPGHVDRDALLRKLATAKVMITFFNDVDLAGTASWIPAVQYFGTKGLFPRYDARPSDPLGSEEAAQWIAAAARVRKPDFDPNRVAKGILSLESKEKEAPITPKDFVDRVLAQFPGKQAERGQWLDLLKGTAAKPVVSRGLACEVLWQATALPVQ